MAVFYRIKYPLTLLCNEQEIKILKKRGEADCSSALFQRCKLGLLSKTEMSVTKRGRYISDLLLASRWKVIRLCTKNLSGYF